MEDSAPADAGQPKVVGELRVVLSAVALGPDYPPTAISAEIGRVAIAAARVDQEYALLLHALHNGRRAEWKFEDLQKHSSSQLRRQALQRLNELFEGQLCTDARMAVEDAYQALHRRHAVMHTVWTLQGPDALTSVDDLVAALESTDPDTALSTLVGRDVDSDDWQTLHPRSSNAGPASVVELRAIRRTLEAAQKHLTDLRFRLASALYSGRPAGARRVLNPDTGEEVRP
jgi:hypothetical protein